MAEILTADQIDRFVVLYEDQRPRTHWDGCAESHAGCAIVALRDSHELLRDRLATAERERDDAEDALRSLASYLSVGGYNAPTVDASVFESKIREGIGALGVKLEEGT